MDLARRRFIGTALGGAFAALTNARATQPDKATHRNNRAAHYRVESRNGLWWWVDSAGELEVSVGVNHVEPVLMLGPYNRASTLERYGSDFVLARAREDTVEAQEGHTGNDIEACAVATLDFNPHGLELDTVVLLQVRFAEVDRAALQELGVNIFSTGATNSIGRISTTQFPTVRGNIDLSSVIGAPLGGFTSQVTLTELLNIFVFRPDLNLGVAIKALEQKSLLQILAEPNLMAISGKEASFLAGGEFPFPVVQGGASGLTAVTIQFKEFGVRLSFVANVTGDGTIHLKVSPEVSALDFANGLTISGFLVPALSTRKVETEVELRDGQSFAIAGLIDKRLTETVQKVPGLGDIPILGNLFKSRSISKTNSELLVMVTPRFVKPLDPSQLPPDPDPSKPFLDNRKFDGKSGEAIPNRGSTRP